MVTDALQSAMGIPPLQMRPMPLQAAHSQEALK
jgi:hypothetical protein